MHEQIAVAISRDDEDYTMSEEPWGHTGGQVFVRVRLARCSCCSASHQVMMLLVGHSERCNQQTGEATTGG